MSLKRKNPENCRNDLSQKTERPQLTRENALRCHACLFMVSEDLCKKKSQTVRLGLKDYLSHDN